MADLIEQEDDAPLQENTVATRTTTSQLIAGIMMGNSGNPGVPNGTAGSGNGDARAGVGLAQRAVAAEQDETITRQLAQVVILQRETIKPKQTKDQQEPRILEYFQYARLVFPLDFFWNVLCWPKIFRFMWYQMMREEKPRGGTAESRRRKKEGIHFDLENYRTVMKDFSEILSDITKVPQPLKPVGTPTFDQYKAVIRKIYKVQIAQGVLKNKSWDHVWISDSMDDLYAYVKERKPHADRKAYKEKLDGEFSPCAICDSYGTIEQLYWRDLHSLANRTVCRGLRHRYIYLQTSSGILRSESMHRDELSDHLGFLAPKLDTDVHQPFLSIGQIGVGKTTHGKKQYMRSTRHRDVKLCGVGAFALYLTHRFYCTEEFHQFTTEDWMNNEKWYDIKTLVDVTASNHKVAMSSNSYAKHMKAILDELGLTCNKILHLGRNMGAKILEMLDSEKDEILDMGQWAKGVYNRSYSTKLPMGAIRKLAGFVGNNTNFYFLPRSAVKPSDKLLGSTPMGAWCYEASVKLEEACTGKQCNTARMFLRLVCDLNEIMLQDAAAMMIVDEERAKTQIFNEIPCFLSEEFKAFKKEMAECLATTQSPLDATLENVPPGVHERFVCQDASITRVHSRLGRIEEEMPTTIKTAVKEALQEDRKERQQEELTRTTMANALVAAAESIISPNRPSSPGPLEMEPEATSPEGASLTSPSPTLLPRVSLSPADSSPNDVQPTATSGAPNLNIVDPSVHVNYRMKPRHNDLTDLYNEWIGADKFQDDFGGVEGRDKLHKAKWRKHWKQGPTAHHSKTRRVVLAIRAVSNERKIHVMDACRQLQEEYELCNKSISNFVPYLQKKGIIPTKGSRGRTKIINQ